MKQSIDRTSRKVSVTLVAALLFMSSCVQDRDPVVKNYTISGNASGSQMVPTTPSAGTGTITGTFNSESNLLTFTSTWSGLSAAPSAAGFYEGSIGAAGTAIGTSWTLGTGIGTSGSYTGTITLTTIQAAELLAGGLYYSYTSATYPAGEIRGQITATPQ